MYMYVISQTVTTSSEKLQFFGDRCREITFSFGEGMPGRTWCVSERGCMCESCVSQYTCAYVCVFVCVCVCVCVCDCSREISFAFGEGMPGCTWCVCVKLCV